MNKQDLTAAVAKKTKMPKSTVMSIIDSCFREIEKSLKKGKDFSY